MNGGMSMCGAEGMIALLNSVVSASHQSPRGRSASATVVKWTHVALHRHHDGLCTSLLPTDLAQVLLPSQLCPLPSLATFHSWTCPAQDVSLHSRVRVVGDGRNGGVAHWTLGSDTVDHRRWKRCCAAMLGGEEMRLTEGLMTCRALRIGLFSSRPPLNCFHRTGAR